MVGWQRFARSVLRHDAARINQISPNAWRSAQIQGHFASLRKVPDISPKRLPGPFHHYLQSTGYFSSRSLLAEDVSNMEPISSPLTRLLGDGRTKAKDAGSKPLFKLLKRA